MIITKFLFLLSGFIVLVGCNTPHFIDDEARRGTGPCMGPNMPSEIVCQYAMLVTDEANGENLPLGVVAPPVINDNIEQQKKDGKPQMENYPSKDKYSLPVKKEDLSKLKKGRVYIFHSVPGNEQKPKAELVLIKEMTLEELDEDLGKNRKDLFKAMMSKKAMMNQ
jgi:hypothetical protein